MISQKHKYKVMARSRHRTYQRKTVRHKKPCKNCGRLFVKQHNRQVYCKGCGKKVRREQKNEAERNYHRRWRSTINMRRVLKPGTTELPKQIQPTWEKELQSIQKEKQRIKFPFKKMYSKHILGF